MDSCYELVADQISEDEWSRFTRKLIFGFKGFPEDWQLEGGLREKLLLKLQWTYFNPDLVEGIANKRSRSWSFMTSFLSEAFKRKFSFLRSRQESEKMEHWDRLFADFEGLLYLSSMDEAMQLDWLANFDAKVRYGEARRVRVIKNKGLGLSCELLGVHVLMDWNEIKARYRFMLKMHHPDVGGDPTFAKQLIEAFDRLSAKAGKQKGK